MSFLDTAIMQVYDNLRNTYEKDLEEVGEAVAAIHLSEIFNKELPELVNAVSKKIMPFSKPQSAKSILEKTETERELIAEFVKEGNAEAFTRAVNMILETNTPLGFMHLIGF